MRILVTGGAGFIGSHVVDLLVAKGHDVFVLDNLDPHVHGERAFLPVNILEHVQQGRVTFMLGDVRIHRDVELAIHGADAVIHLAGAVGVGRSMYKHHHYTTVNVGGQGVLNEVMAKDPRRYRRLIVASSVAVYGEGAYLCEKHGMVTPGGRKTADLDKGEYQQKCPICESPVEIALTDEDKPLEPLSTYAMSKRAQEDLALLFSRVYKVPTHVLRFFNVYGSRQSLNNPYAGIAANIVSSLKNGKRPLVFEDGEQSRDFILVSDLARGIVMALDADPSLSGPYNLCTGYSVSINQLAEMIAAFMGLDLKPELVGSHRKGDVRHCIGNPLASLQDWGFRAEVSFEDGLNELIAWAKTQEATSKMDDALEELRQHRLVKPAPKA